MNETIGKTLYGSLFVTVLTTGILFWERRLENVTRGLPTITKPVMGSLLVASGICLMFFAWIAIVKYGKGLSMSVFLHEKLMYQGVYAIIPHPIYSGFAMIVAGHSIFTGSAAGIWVVTPSIILCSLALIVGYERFDIESRFGNRFRRAAIRLPADEEKAPAVSERISAYVLVSLPWIVLYEAVILLGPAPDAFETYFVFEDTFPVLEWTELIYASTYLLVSVAPLVARRQKDLRDFMLMGLWSTVLGIVCFLLLPFKATPRPFVASSIWGELLLMEQSFDGPAGAFPSFHVIWALLAAWLYAQTSRIVSLWYIVAGVIALSCITTGMHSLLDVVGAVIAYIFVLNRKAIWFRTLNFTERLANSWREWRIGGVRVMIHGVYVGLGAFIGVATAMLLAGWGQVWYVLIVAFVALVGAGIWGRALEGSSKVSKPLSYYGGLLGSVLGVAVSTELGADGWRLAGALAAAEPFAQAIGRFRCLAQGCCHGRECSCDRGIVFVHERSCVIQAGLGSRPIYPTQLYSILYNVVLGAFLIRAWTLSIPMPQVIGGYLMFGGIGRFIEESFRGDLPPKYVELRLYQWFALARVISGAIIMTFPQKPCVLEVTAMPWFLLYAVVFGIIVALAMSVEFSGFEVQRAENVR